MSRQFWPLVLLAFCVPLLPGWSQQMHRNSFEGHTPLWVKGPANADYEQTIHAMSDQGHDGQRSEYLQINAKRGNYIYYQYPTAHAPIADELSVGLWVKANRPNVQLLARLVLPKEQNPTNLNDRRTIFLRGGIYTTVGRWQRLELGRAITLTKQQQQLLQAQEKRAIDFTDAYIDMLILNVYTGPGTTEVWMDELELGPVLENTSPAAKPVAETPTKQVLQPPGSDLVQFSLGHLLVGDKRFFFRGIRLTDTPIRTLRDAGFNTLFLDQYTPAEVNQAIDCGFYVVPTLPVTGDNTRLVSELDVTREVRTFPDGNHVLFWNLGNALAQEQATAVSLGTQLIRSVDRQRPLGVDAWDGLKKYSGKVDLLGVHRWPLMTTMELMQYRDWLEQRGRLANARTFLWTWIQTHLPDHYTQLLYNQPGTAGFREPIGPMPEQIRLLTYASIGAGCKGVAYWSDRFLADSHQGRDRLLTLALLNQEIDLIEPLLVKVTDAPMWIDTSSPDVKAAVLRTSNAVLVLPMWLGPGGQYVPGQAAFRGLTLTIPHVPQSWQAWEVSPGDARSYLPKRVAMGVQITLQEFGLTTALVFTADSKMIVRFQELARDRRQQAAQWTYDLAVKELEKVEQVQAQLEKLNHTQPDAAALLQDARERLQTARKHWDAHLFSEAYHESQRALRPVRILMRAQWDKAVKTLNSPVASPYALSFYTLPRHLEFMDQVKKATPTANLLVNGDFEQTSAPPPEARWSSQEITLDEVVLHKPELVSQVWTRPPKTGPGGKPLPPPTDGRPLPPPPKKFDPPQQGKQCLMLEIKPKTPLTPPEVLDRTFLAVSSPAVQLPPGSLVQVSCWLNVPEAIKGSQDGAMFFDNAGGEPLAVRRGQTTGWERFTLYRRVPASGVLNVTLALAGIGTAFFDDVRIEPLVTTPLPAVKTPVGSGVVPVPTVPAPTVPPTAGALTGTQRPVPVPTVPVKGAKGN